MASAMEVELTSCVRELNMKCSAGIGKQDAGRQAAAAGWPANIHKQKNNIGIYRLKLLFQPLIEKKIKQTYVDKQIKCCQAIVLIMHTFNFMKLSFDQVNMIS